MPQDLSGFLTLAEELAELARPIARRYFRDETGLEIKPDGTPVTRADREIEEVMRRHLAERVPGHGVIGEEFGAEREDAEFVWVLDPIDGTRAFAAGKPTFGTLVGLLREGRPVVGLIDQPINAERWTGAEGLGAFFQGEPCRVRAERPLNRAVVASGRPERLMRLNGVDYPRLSSDCAWVVYDQDCYHYGLLAMGQIDATLENGLDVHDWAAVVPVVTQAGGFIGDWEGRPLDRRSKGEVVAATSPALARAVLGSAVGREASW